jgi:hypothetical protein
VLKNGSDEVASDGRLIDAVRLKIMVDSFKENFSYRKAHHFQ